MGGQAYYPEAPPIMARTIPPYTMITVCGRTRMLLSLAIMLSLLLLCSYLYMEPSQAEFSPLQPQLHGTRRRHRPLMGREARARPYDYHQHQARRAAFSPRKIFHRDFNPTRGRLSRHAQQGQKRSARLSDNAHHSKLVRSNEASKNNLIVVGERDGNTVYVEEPDREISHFTSDVEVEENDMELNEKVREWEEIDLPKRASLFIKKNQRSRRKNLLNVESQNKLKTKLNQNLTDRNKEVKPKNYKKHSTDSRALPDFNAERFRSQALHIKINEALFHDKWIVVTSILQPTPDIIYLSKIPDWKVLTWGIRKHQAIGDCVFLGVAEQERLGLFLPEHTPYRSYARKNIGYLFAIAHGAKVIYETDDDNRPLDLLKSFQLAPTMSGLMFAGDGLFNPYHHFGQSTLWPRGFPLGAVGSTLSRLYRLSSKWTTPAIQQGVVNGDPDMDAIFRLTRKQTTSRLEVTFDPAGPPAILPEGVYSPFNSQNTLFRYEALWAMLLPTTTTFRMCDIWRGYWAQRLLWEIGARLAFFPPNAYQQRNAHSYMEDAEDERDMYFETDRLLKFLSNWSCPQEHTFFQCVYMLSVGMAEQKFWKAGDIKVTRLWLEDLVRVGYREPERSRLSIKDTRTIKHRGKVSHIIERQSKENKQHKSGKSELEIRRLLTLKNGTSAYFAASQQNPPSVYTKNSLRLGRASFKANDIATMCSESTNISVKADLIRHGEVTYFDDILLVVVFNWPHYSNVKYLETIYRNVFPNIAYCGGNSDVFLAETKELDIDLTFINAPVLIGVYGYACFIAAAQMGYNVTGYMVVGDDVLVNMWNFHGFDKDRIWSNFAVHIFNVNNGTNWSWWGFQVGEQAYNKSMAAIRKQQREQSRDTPHQDYIHNERPDSWRLEKFSNPVSVKPAKAFLSTLFQNTGGASNCPHAVSDVYYIPARLAPSAVYYMSLFARQGLMVELAIATTIYGLSVRGNIQFFSGDNLWLDQRLDPWRKFNPLSFFLHPVKFSNSSNLQPLCSQYLTTLLNKIYQVGSEAFQSNNTSHASRRAYIERLQRSYRERQDLQKTWLQQELLAMKRRKEKLMDQMEHKEEMVSEHEQKLHAQPKQQRNSLRHASPLQLENKDQSDDRDTLQLERKASKLSGSHKLHRKQLQSEETQPRPRRNENHPEGKETSNEHWRHENGDHAQQHEEVLNLSLDNPDADEPYLDENLFEEEPDEDLNNQEQSKDQNPKSKPRLKKYRDEHQDDEKLNPNLENNLELDEPDERSVDEADEDPPPQPQPAVGAPQPGKANQIQQNKYHANTKTSLRHNVRDEY